MDKWIKISKNVIQFVTDDENADILAGGLKGAIQEYYKIRSRAFIITGILFIICAAIIWVRYSYY